MKVSRITTERPKAPASDAVAVATGNANVGKTIPEGTSTDAVAALVGRYHSKKRRGAGKGCCPGSSRSY